MSDEQQTIETGTFDWNNLGFEASQALRLAAGIRDLYAKVELGEQLLIATVETYQALRLSDFVKRVRDAGKDFCTLCGKSCLTQDLQLIYLDTKLENGSHGHEYLKREQFLHSACPDCIESCILFAGFAYRTSEYYHCYKALLDDENGAILIQRDGVSFEPLREQKHVSRAVAHPSIGKDTAQEWSVPPRLDWRRDLASRLTLRIDGVEIK